MLELKLCIFGIKYVFQFLGVSEPEHGKSGNLTYSAQAVI